MFYFNWLRFLFLILFVFCFNSFCLASKNNDNNKKNEEIINDKDTEEKFILNYYSSLNNNYKELPQKNNERRNSFYGVNANAISEFDKIPFNQLPIRTRIKEVGAMITGFTLLVNFGWNIYQEVDKNKERLRSEKLTQKDNFKSLKTMYEIFSSRGAIVNWEENIERLCHNFNFVVGQKSAKKKIYDQFSSHILRLAKFFGQEHGWETGKKGPGVEYYLLVGKPGLGKSEISNRIVDSYCLDGKLPFTIEASTILNLDKRQRKMSSLFYSIEKYKEGKKIVVNSNLFSYIKSCSLSFLIFNEIDKLLDDNDLRLDLFEFLRTLKEQGYVYNEKGEMLDCSGLTIIFTANNPDLLSEDSIRSRFNIISFDSFSLEEYSELIKMYFEKYIFSLNKFFESKNVEFVFDKKIYDSVAKDIFSDEKLSCRGSRSIYIDYNNNLHGTIISWVREKLAKQEHIKGNKKKVVISYGDKKNPFILSD